MSELYDSDPARWTGEQAQAISMEDLPVFQQKWWVEIACGTAHLNEAQVVEGSIVVGRLPFMSYKETKPALNAAAFSIGRIWVGQSLVRI